MTNHMYAKHTLGFSDIMNGAFSTLYPLLLPDYATKVELSSSLSLPRLFCSRTACLCFHPFLVPVLFSGPSLLVVNFYRKILPLVFFTLLFSLFNHGFNCYFLSILFNFLFFYSLLLFHFQFCLMPMT